jgi:hypothetical protein
MLILDHGQEQRNLGQWEEAQTRSRVIMVMRLYNSEELLSHTPWKCQILQSQKERVRMIRTEMHASSP